MLESEGDGNSLSHLGPPNAPGRSPRVQHQVNPFLRGASSPHTLWLVDTSPLSPGFARSVLAGLTRPRSVARPRPHQKRSQTSYGDQEAYCEWDRSPHLNLKSYQKERPSKRAPLGPQSKPMAKTIKRSQQCKR